MIVIILLITIIDFKNYMKMDYININDKKIFGKWI